MITKALVAMIPCLAVLFSLDMLHSMKLSFLTPLFPLPNIHPPQNLLSLKTYDL